MDRSDEARNRAPSPLLGPCPHPTPFPLNIKTIVETGFLWGPGRAEKDTKQPGEGAEARRESPPPHSDSPVRIGMEAGNAGVGKSDT